MRSGEFILPREADFWTALQDRREKFEGVRTPESSKA
jgi:hypothetical protein